MYTCPTFALHVLLVLRRSSKQTLDAEIHGLLKLRAPYVFDSAGRARAYLYDTPLWEPSS